MMEAMANKSEAVEALHETMVLLRDELAKKNLRIQNLESKLTKNNNVFDEILVENEANSQQQGLEPVEDVMSDFVKIEDYSKVTEDPVLEFKLSDDELEDVDDEATKQLDSMEVSDVRVHTLIIKKDIDVHFPPSRKTSNFGGLTVSPIRPILKLPSSSPRSCTGSQTDISALSPGSLQQHYQHSDHTRTGSAEPRASQLLSMSNGRNWGSEPSLIHESRGQGHSRASSISSSVTFVLPDEKPKACEVDHQKVSTTTVTTVKNSHIYSGGVVKKLVVKNRRDRLEGGRYSILNRNFEPLTIEIDQEVDYKKANIDWEAFDKLKNLQYNFTNGVHSARSSSGDSTDSLIEEANDYLQVAQSKLVTIDDWNEISNKKNTRRNEKLNNKRCSSQNGDDENVGQNNHETQKLPYVPHKIGDLKMHDNVRFIAKSNQLIQGQIVDINVSEECVQIIKLENNEIVRDKDAIDVPFEKIVMVWKSS